MGGIVSAARIDKEVIKKVRERVDGASDPANEYLMDQTLSSKNPEQSKHGAFGHASVNNAHQTFGNATFRSA